MVHKSLQRLSGLWVLDQIQLFIDLDEVVERVSGLKGIKLSLCHHYAADDHNDFTLSNRSRSKYAIAVNR